VTVRALRAALYCRVSTTGQTSENQLLALRAFAEARGWTVTEFVDSGVSGAKEKRPALDAMLAAVRARKVDLVAAVKLDRLARSVHHLVAMVREFEALGVDLIVLDQSIDTTTPSGRLLFHVLAAISEFERDLIRDRVLAGLARARAQGKRLRRPRAPVDLGRVVQMRAAGVSVRGVARALKISPMSVTRALTDLETSRLRIPSAGAPVSPRPPVSREG
jgi:DNA invertase Pin-like site-specific DNA recombinase